MKSIDIIGIACVALISLSFYVSRSRLSLLCAICTIVTASSIGIVSKFVRQADLSEGIILVLGIALYGTGLVIVRIILRRSVSLHLLSGYISGKAEWDIAKEISVRLEESINYRLAVRNDNKLQLSPFGKLITSIMWLLYKVTRN